MQRPSAPNPHLPYSKWSQHRADNGLIYLSHPITSETKWLWSRHVDPKTSNDYLVNTVTGERQWVTKENEHLCPVSPDKSKQQHDNDVNAPLTASTNPFAEKRAHRSKPANPIKPDPSDQKPECRPIAAPKSMGLTADEVLMLIPESGRRYIFNKKTHKSRWVPDRPPDTISSASSQRTFLGRSKANPSSSVDDDIHPQLREKTKTPFFDPHESTRHDHTSGASTAHNSDSDTAQNNSTNIPLSKQLPQAPHTSRQPRANDPRSLPTMTSNPDSNLATQPNHPATPTNAASNQDSSRRPHKEKDPVAFKLNALGSVLDDVNDITKSGKYDMNQMRRLPSIRGKEEVIKDGSRRLLELEEYLTQQMLKVDAVESEGNQLVRAKRKEAVNTILGLTDEIEQLRKKLKNL